MFERTSRLAECVAASVSRRGFLGVMGRWAAGAALGLGAVLTGSVAAGGGKHGTCCYYAACGSCKLPGITCSGVRYCDLIVVQPGSSCPPTYAGCPLSFSSSPDANGCKC
jgi:hypothetical protein